MRLYSYSDSCIRSANHHTTTPLHTVLNSCLTIPLDCDASADITFILDASSSVGIPNYARALEFIIGVLADADIDGGKVRVALASFRYM